MQNPAWIRPLFAYDNLTTADINNPYLKLQTFWCQQMESLSLVAKDALEVLTPFVTVIYASIRFLFSWMLKHKNQTDLHAKMT